MSTTMKLIAKTTLGSSASSVTIGSGGTIPQTYTDLMLVGTFNNANSVVDNARLRVNGATSDTNHSSRLLTGNGGSAASSTASLIYVAASFGSNGLSSFEVYIPNYTAAVNKSMTITGVAEVNQATAYIYAVAGLWANTAAITELNLSHLSGSSFAANSAFYLYGITKA